MISFSNYMIYVMTIYSLYVIWDSSSFIRIILDGIIIVVDVVIHAVFTLLQWVIYPITYIIYKLGYSCAFNSIGNIFGYSDTYMIIVAIILIMMTRKITELAGNIYWDERTTNWNMRNITFSFTFMIIIFLLFLENITNGIIFNMLLFFIISMTNWWMSVFMLCVERYSTFFIADKRFQKLSTIMLALCTGCFLLHTVLIPFIISIFGIFMLVTTILYIQYYSNEFIELFRSEELWSLSEWPYVKWVIDTCYYRN
jgi:hypothetical protein